MSRKNLLVDEYLDFMAVGALGNYPHTLFEARNTYKKKGRFEVDFGEPELKQEGGKTRHFLAGNIYEPEPCALTVVRYDFGVKPDTSVITYGFKGNILNLTLDFLSVIGMEPLPPTDEFRNIMETNITAIQKIIFDMFQKIPRELAKTTYAEAIRLNKQTIFNLII